MEWERRLSELWASIDDDSEEAFLTRMEHLVADLPADSAVVAFERAVALDLTGHSVRAVPAYRRALELGLPDPGRCRAVIQLASSLPTIGHASESVALRSAELELGPDALDDALRAVLALALVDLGWAREAVSLPDGVITPHDQVRTLPGQRRRADFRSRLDVSHPGHR